MPEPPPPPDHFEIKFRHEYGSYDSETFSAHKQPIYRYSQHKIKFTTRIYVVAGNSDFQKLHFCKIYRVFTAEMQPLSNLRAFAYPSPPPPPDDLEIKFRHE